MLPEEVQALLDYEGGLERYLSLAKTSSVLPGKGLGQLRRGPLSG